MLQLGMTHALPCLRLRRLWLLDSSTVPETGHPCAEARFCSI